MHCRVRAPAPPPSINSEGVPFLIPDLSNALVESKILSALMCDVSVTHLMILSVINSRWYEMISGTLEWQVFLSIRGHSQLVPHLQEPTRAYAAFVGYLFELFAERYRVSLVAEESRQRRGR
jgi:ABC-type uncharacterized transport system involved in gliding motility auxiliary subunit